MDTKKHPYWLSNAEVDLLLVAVRLRIDAAKENQEADGPEWVNTWKKLYRRLSGKSA